MTVVKNPKAPAALSSIPTLALPLARRMSATRRIKEGQLHRPRSSLGCSGEGRTDGDEQPEGDLEEGKESDEDDIGACRAGEKGQHRSRKTGALEEARARFRARLLRALPSQKRVETYEETQ